MYKFPNPLKQFAAICLGLEILALSGHLAGLGEGIRNGLISVGGFWPGMLWHSPAGYPGQPIIMFASSAFLHGNPVHLLMNVFGLLWLGNRVVEWIGTAGFWPLVGLSSLGAGLLYVLLSSSSVPMVGASGVLFGFLGTVATWEALDRYERAESLAPLFKQAVALLALNLALALSAQGSIAWEAHVGGFLAGTLGGLLTWQRPHTSRWS